MIDKLFFELVRVSIGTADNLSEIPTSKDWQMLYEIAKNQSLVGICFVGIQRLHEYRKEMPQALYLKWMGFAAKIQQRNEVVNKQCIELLNQVSHDGFRCCITKGQGVAQLYGANLSLLRQSGDIDIWICPNGEYSISHNKRVKIILDYLHSIGKCSNTTYHNTSITIFKDTDVEAHYTPSWMYSPFKNRYLQHWFSIMSQKEMNQKFSTNEFNLVYIMVHIYRHLFGEGIGLRQCLDYYFVLLAIGAMDNNDELKTNALYTFKSLGLLKFAGALMYVMQEVFGIEKRFLLCSPNLEEGEFLLKEILTAGNFGQHDERIKHSNQDGAFARFSFHVTRNFRFLSHYPSEVLWCPFWKIWHQHWLKKYK